MIVLTGTHILAVPFRERRRLKWRRLPDGFIVDRCPTGLRTTELPRDTLNLKANELLPWDDDVYGRVHRFYLLLDGDVVAVYGAKAEPVG